MAFLLKIVYAFTGIAAKGFPKIIGAAAASKKVAALTVLVVGLVCMLLFFSLEIATQDQSAADHQMRKDSLNGLTFDDPFYVAMDSVDICEKAREKDIKKSRKACIRADADYKAAFPLMDPSFLANRMKDGDYARRKTELERALHFQQAQRAAFKPETYAEQVRPLIQSNVGILSLLFLVIGLPMFGTVCAIESKRAEMVRQANPTRRLRPKRTRR
jgi:hypothetical protein